MELSVFMRSIVEMDIEPIVICDLSHTIIYMNPAAVCNYKKRGGAELVGKSLLACHNEHSCEIIRSVVQWFQECNTNNIKFTYYNPKHNKDVYMVALRDENQNLIGYYEKHECRTRENEG